MALRDQTRNALRRVWGDRQDDRDSATSASAAALRHHSPSMFSVWGREDIGGLLTVSQSLMDRFADYEAMEEYPDIHCVAEGMRVYVVSQSVIKPVKIEDLVLSNEWPDILAYDVKKKKLTSVQASHPRLTGLDADVVAVQLSNGSVLRVTPTHKLLTTDGYVDAKDVAAGVKIVSAWPAFDPGSVSMFVRPVGHELTVVKDPAPAGKARVFDISTRTHNFVCEGAVVHNSAFRYYCTDSTQPNIKDQKIVWITSDQRALRGMLMDLLHKRLRIEHEIESMAYTLAMYGNCYEELLLTNTGVVGLNHLPVPTMRRVERLDGGLIGYVQDITGQFTANAHELRAMLAGQTEIPRSLALFEDWNVLHFRMRMTRRRSPYGISIGEPARWVWKRITMMEDGALMTRLQRVPRYAYYIDTTDVPPDRYEGFLRKAKRDLKKRSMVNPRTGRLDARYAPYASDEDIFIATSGGTDKARVEVLSAPDYSGMEDIEYFKRMLHGALAVPREYLGQEAAIPSRSVLSNEDVRAARITLALQRELRFGLEVMCRTHLAARGVTNPWRPDFEVAMTVPSGIWELAAYETLNAHVDYASRIQPFVSVRWIQENVLKLDDATIKEIEKQRKKEAGMETSGDVPSYAGGPPPAPPEPESPVGGEPNEKPPEKPRTPEEWRAWDNHRRLEEWRYRESCRRHAEIMDKVDALLEQGSSNFAYRERQRRDFFAELRKTAFHRNGKALPSGTGRRI